MILREGIEALGEKNIIVATYTSVGSNYPLLLYQV